LKDRFLGLLGIAMKAGAVSSGEFAAEKSVKGGISKLLILSEDASEGTEKKFRNMCDYYHVPMLIKGSKETNGAALGKDERSVISVNDRGFADALEALVKTSGK